MPSPTTNSRTHRLLNVLIRLASGLISLFDEANEEDKFYLANWETRLNYAYEMVEAHPTRGMYRRYDRAYNSACAGKDYMTSAKEDRNQIRGPLEKKLNKWEILLRYSSSEHHPSVSTLLREIRKVEQECGKYEEELDNDKMNRFEFDMDFEDHIRRMEETTQAPGYGPPEE